MSLQNQTQKITKNMVFGDPPPSGSPPSTFANNTLLFEIDTGIIHKFVSGSWTMFSGPVKTEIFQNKTIDCSSSGGNNVITNIPSTALISISDKTKLPTDAVYLNDTQVLTNKTLDQFVLGPVTSTPTDPATNYSKIYIKTIDANNQGIFYKIKKNGSFVEGQLV